MKEWFALNSADKKEWLTLAGEALEHVSQLSMRNEAPVKKKGKIKSGPKKLP